MEARAGLAALQQARGTTARELDAERRHLADAERRGRLAAEVPDPETVRIAGEFVARHRERVEFLVRKLALQDDEVRLGEREAEELVRMLREARGPEAGARASLDAARRALESLDEPPDARAREDAALTAELDRRRREAAVEAQLAELKRRLRRD